LISLWCVSLGGRLGAAFRFTAVHSRCLLCVQVPFVNIPPEGFDAHECPRRTPAGQAQMFEFFESGRIVNYCGDAGCHANQSVC
jgi:hypothetical protein